MTSEPKAASNSGAHWTTQAFTEFVQEFQNESDRAAVIIGAAKLDYLLAQILAKYLLPSTAKSDELLEGDSPLSTFSAKIALTYRLGLIDAKLSRALNLIRRLRNSFAHEVSGCSLESGPHRDRIREIVSPFSREPVFEDFREVFIAKKTGAAADLFALLGLIALALESYFDTLATVTAKPLSLIPKHYTSRSVRRRADGTLENISELAEPDAPSGKHGEDGSN
jgi:hypothetical protein